MSDQSYYNDSTQWGNYITINLEQFVNDYMATVEEGDVLPNVSRTSVLYHTARGLHELNRTVLKEPKYVQRTISATLELPVPQDFISIVMLYWLKDGVLYPMAENNEIDISYVFAQDSNYDLTFDGNGNVLYTTAVVDPTEGPVNSYEYFEVSSPAFAPNKDMSKSHQYGSYRWDSNTNSIKFDSNLFSKDVVLVYLSDGLWYDTNTGRDQTEADIKIHKDAVDCLRDYIYWKLIQNKSREVVSQSEKQRARAQFYNAKRQLNKRIHLPNKQNWLHAMSGANRWIKDSQIKY